MQGFRVELKVCEGCGALWLRAAGLGSGHEVYCGACALLLSELPAVRRSRCGRKRKVRTAVCAGGAR